MTNKEIKRLVKALEEQGFDVVPTKKNHLRVFLDGIWVTTLPSTPSDWRGFRNALAAAKRAGFKWPP